MLHRSANPGLLRAQDVDHKPVMVVQPAAVQDLAFVACVAFAEGETESFVRKAFVEVVQGASC